MERSIFRYTFSSKNLIFHCFETTSSAVFLCVEKLLAILPVAHEVYYKQGTLKMRYIAFICIHKGPQLCHSKVVTEKGPEFLLMMSP